MHQLKTRGPRLPQMRAVGAIFARSTSARRFAGAHPYAKLIVLMPANLTAESPPSQDNPPKSLRREDLGNVPVANFDLSMVGRPVLIQRRDHARITFTR